METGGQNPPLIGDPGNHPGFQLKAVKAKPRKKGKQEIDRHSQRLNLPQITAIPDYSKVTCPYSNSHLILTEFKYPLEKNSN